MMPVRWRFYLHAALQSDCNGIDRLECHLRRVAGNTVYVAREFQ